MRECARMQARLRDDHSSREFSSMRVLFYSFGELTGSRRYVFFGSHAGILQRDPTPGAPHRRESARLCAVLLNVVGDYLLFKRDLYVAF